MLPDLNQKWLAVLRAFPSLLSPPAEPNERLPADPFALVSAGRLTRFQYDLLSSGQGKELILGNYVLVDQIGEGGMGVVYKARHAKLGRTVAVKVIRTERLKTKTAVRRFVREVRASAKLDHPLIVRALDADSIDGRHFLAMEYVDGCDLVTEIEHGPLPIVDVLAVAFQVALALQHLYENGVVHRDLKPTNLIRDRKTQAVKVLDLGLSRIINPDGGAESAALTQAGTIIGTPDYMAPEQGQDVRIADTRSDLYSLGCTLYFLLTGRVPFPGGTTIEKILRHCQEKPTPVTAFRPDVPPEVLAVIERLMSREPDDRFQTPAELIAALTVLGTMPPSPGGRATGATGSNPSLHLPAVTPTALPVSDIQRAPGDSSWRVALAEVIARDSTISGRHPIPKPSRKVRLKEYRSTVLASTGLLAAVLLLAAAVVPWSRIFPAPPAPTEPGDEPRALRDRIAKWLETKDPAVAPALRADAEAALRKAAGTADAVTIAKYLKQLPSPLDKLPEPPAHATIGTARQRTFGAANTLALSPDGKKLVVGGWDRSVQVWNPDTMTTTFGMTFHTTPIVRVAISADGKQVAGVSGFQDRDRDEGFERGLRVVDLARKDDTLKVDNEPNSGGWSLSAAFTPEGSVLAGQFEAATLWTPVGKGFKATRKFHVNGMNWCISAAVSVDGKTGFTGGSSVSYAEHDHALVWDLTAPPPPLEKNGYPTAEKPAHRLPGHRGPVMAVVPHPDNQRVLTVDHGAARIFDYTTGKLFKELRTSHGELFSGCWSSGGKEVVLATASGRIVWLDPASGNELRVGAGHLGRVNAVVAHGKHVFSAGEDGTVRKWDAATGTEIQPVTPSYSAARIAFADEDRKVVVLPARGALATAAVTETELTPATTGGLADVEGLALMADGTKALVRSPTTGRATVWDFPTSTATECPAWPESGDVKAAALSPDGKRVWYAVSRDKDPSGTLRWTDLETGETVKFSIPPEVGGDDTKANREHRITAREVTAVAVSPDGKFGVAATRGREVFGWEFATYKLTMRHKPQADHPGIARQLTFGPIGRRVFGVGLGSNVWVVPLGTARTDEFFPTTPNSTPRCVAMSADDETLAIGGWDGDLHLYNASGVLKRTIKTAGPVTAIAFSTDGRGLAAALANGTVALYKLVGP